MVYGNVPFIANSVPAVYEKIKHEKLNFPDIPQVSNDLKDLMEKMLTKDPSKRMTLPHIKVLLTTWYTNLLMDNQYLPFSGTQVGYN